MSDEAYLLLGGTPGPYDGATVPPPERLHRDGARLVGPSGQRFRWRGATGFRLLELLHTGRHAQAESYLDWCRSVGINIVRIFVTCQNLFALSCEDGRRQLAAAHSLAAARGLYLENVLLTDTEQRWENWEAHVAACGEILADWSNALIEVVNEPMQHWQSFSPATLQGYAMNLIGTGVPFTLGAADGANDESKAYWWDPCHYFVVHASRLREPWGNVRHTKEQWNLMEDINQYTVNDEWGKDLHPSRQFAVGGICAVLDLGDTHHSDLLRDCQVLDEPPDGITDAERAAYREELEAVTHRRAAWDFVPDAWQGTFANFGWTPPNPVSPCASFVGIDDDSRVYSSVTETEAYVVASHVNPHDVFGNETLIWKPGWMVVKHSAVGSDAHMYHLVR